MVKHAVVEEPRVARVRAGGARRVTLQGSNWTARPPQLTAWQSERAYGPIDAPRTFYWSNMAAKVTIAIVGVIGWTAFFAWKLQ